MAPGRTHYKYEKQSCSVPFECPSFAYCPSELLLFCPDQQYLSLRPTPCCLPLEDAPSARLVSGSTSDLKSHSFYEKKPSTGRRLSQFLSSGSTVIASTFI